MKSIISFPERGAWGDSRWRGNCSGHVQKELIGHFRPKLFVDVCEGSGTSRDVCKELGIEYVGLDLHRGFDFTANSVLAQLPHPADLVFSHPPYGAMIDYRAVGKWDNPNLKGQDLSACSEEEFLEKSRIMLLNQREAAREGGIYCTLIGDLRSKGRFRSFQADYINFMPQDELVSVTIKTQHNCVSDARQYSGSFIPIMHEYLLIWKKASKTLVRVTLDTLRNLKQQVARGWRSLIRTILLQEGGAASLGTIYQRVEKEAVEMLVGYASSANWKAKIRQTLQHHFDAVERGVWALPAAA